MSEQTDQASGAEQAEGQAALAGALCELANLFSHRGWALGGGGYFTAVVGREPLRLLTTPDGLDKTTIEPGDLVELGESQVEQTGWPAVRLHALLARHAGAGAVVQTQSPAALAVSRAYAGQHGIMLEGYDLLRHVAGGRGETAGHWLGVIEHDPDSAAPGRQLVAQLNDPRRPARYGMLVRQCGLLSWGRDLDEARRHAEVFEAVLAAVVSRAALRG